MPKRCLCILSLTFLLKSAHCNKEYIGETKQQFSTRTGEHKKAVASKQTKKLALAEHSVKQGHKIDLESASILRRCENWRQWRFLEAWEIDVCPDLLNPEDGKFLPREYLCLTFKVKNNCL